MTKEEAGQRILEGTDCPNGCAHAVVYEDPSMCPLCKGFGSVVDPTYEKACELLDIPVPTVVPPNTLNLIVDIRLITERTRKVPIKRKEPMKGKSG